jgi:glucokinase
VSAEHAGAPPGGADPAREPVETGGQPPLEMTEPLPARPVAAAALGRPPLEPADHRLAVGLDIGGTKIAGGVVDADGHIVERTRVPTPQDTEEEVTVTTLAKVIDDLRARQPGVEAIGVGAAGLVEWPAGRIVWAPHNPYRDLPLRRLLHELTGLPTVVDNDANAAAWAEARYGAGTGSDEMILLTVGTGVGGGLVLGGHVYRGMNGLGAEMGHMIVDPDGAPCSCGSRGCLEAMVSGTALERMGREAVHAHPDGGLARYVGAPDRVTGPLLYDAAVAGDATARGLFELMGYWLGIGIASLITIFDPELVVVGGGMIATGDLLLAPARASLKRYVFGAAYRTLPPVVPARLGPDAGLVGAATLALRVGG